MAKTETLKVLRAKLKVVKAEYREAFKVATKAMRVECKLDKALIRIENTIRIAKLEDR